MSLSLLLALLVAAAGPADAPATRPAGAGSPAPAAGGVRPKPPPPTHVDADHIEYRYKERQTIMTGKPLVTLTREDATLVCKRLVADSEDSGDIRDAVCEGDVKLTRGERTVTCLRATYEGLTGRVICRGDPILRDGESIIRCDEVVYELDADKVLLKHPKGTLVQKPGQPLPVAKRAADSDDAKGRSR